MFRFMVHRKSGTIVSVTHSDEDLPFGSLMDLFEEFAIAAGYARETIEDYYASSTSGTKPSKGSE